MDDDMCRLSGSRMKRGSGLHQSIGLSSSYQGKTPWLYAESNTPGDRFPCIPIIPGEEKLAGSKSTDRSISRKGSSERSNMDHNFFFFQVYQGLSSRLKTAEEDLIYKEVLYLLLD